VQATIAVTGKVALPLPILRRVYDAARDTRLSAAAINTFAVLATYADENGIVGVDEHGRSMSEWANISRQLDAGQSTVRKMLTKLEGYGYLQWDRAWSQERGTPIPGAVSKIRIILPDQTL
jgi:hypothetical protein